MWVSDPIFINDSFSLSHNSTNLDFLYLFPKKIYGFECFVGIGLVVGFMGLVLCWRLILQEIYIFVIVGFCSHLKIAMCFACLVA